jgi:hypothetical protein
MSAPFYAMLSKDRKFRRKLKVPSLSVIVSKTLEKHRDAIAENVTRNNALLEQMRQDDYFADLRAMYDRYDEYCKLPWYKRVIPYIRGTYPVSPYR